MKQIKNNNIEIQDNYPFFYCIILYGLLINWIFIDFLFTFLQ